MTNDGREFEGMGWTGARSEGDLRERVPRDLASEIHLFREVASTNDVGLALARERPGESHLGWADAQTRGRGRRGRAWFSPPGTGLSVSLVLWPERPLEAPTLALAAAVGVAAGLRRGSGVEARVRWPNDLTVRGRKISGILVEVTGGAAPGAVVGIGVNVNQRPEDFPRELDGRATSLLIETGRPADRLSVLEALLSDLARVHARWKDGGFGALRADWEGLWDDRGAAVRVREGERTLAGTALGVEEDGALRIRDSRGRVRRVVSGDVERIDV